MSGTPNTLYLPRAETYNGIFWGVFVSTALFGVNTVQGWIYLNTNQDKWPLRLLVTILLLMDTAHLILGGQILHYYFVENFGNLETFLKVSVHVNAELSITIGVVFVVQMYFASRVYLLHRARIWLPTLIVICTTGTFVAGIVSNYDQIKQQNRVSALVSKSLMIEAGIDHSMATLTDIITTIALSVTLSGRQVYFNRTKNVVQKVLRYTVTRGFVVTVVQLLFLITYEAAPTNLNWAIFHYSLSRMYIVTMLAMLNSRIPLRLELGEPLEINTSALQNSQNTPIMLIELTRNSRGVESGMNADLPKDQVVGHENKLAGATPVIEQW